MARWLCEEGRSRLALHQFGLRICNGRRHTGTKYWNKCMSWKRGNKMQFCVDCVIRVISRSSQVSLPPFASL
eukprot:4534618-Amphidinium_carterae.1